MGKTQDPGLRKAIKAAGSIRALAGKIGIAHQAVAQWSRIPAKRLLQVEKASGIPREELRPELYQREQNSDMPYDE